MGSLEAKEEKEEKEEGEGEEREVEAGSGQAATVVPGLVTALELARSSHFPPIVSLDNRTNDLLLEHGVESVNVQWSLWIHTWYRNAHTRFHQATPSCIHLIHLAF